MIVKDYHDGKIIILSRAFDNRAKILNIIYFAAFTFAGLLFLNMVVSTENKSISLIIFAVAVVGIYLFAGFKFINKAFEAEKIFMTKTILTVSKSGFLSQEVNSYSIAQISNFRHLAKTESTKHPLSGQSFDYFGFQTEQQVINEMHGDNRIAFDYEDKTIKFGQNIYSWHFDQLEILIYDITGNDFRYIEDFEKKLSRI